MLKNKLKEIMETRGIESRYQVAKDTGISKTTLFHLYHNEDAIPRDEVIDKLCNAYDLTPNDVIQHIKS